MPCEVAAGRTAGQIEIARQLGADGFVLFNYNDYVPQLVAPLVQSLLRLPATTPHNTPRFAFDIGEMTQEQAYGRHVPEGGTVTATVRREEEAIAGRDFGEVTAIVVLEDADGQVVRELGPAPTTNSTQEVTISAAKGLHRLVVVGEYRRADGTERSFVVRSLPIVFGEIADDIAALL
jgi:hypothetical protein